MSCSPSRPCSTPPPAPTQAEVVATQNEKLDAARKTILAPIGTTSYEVTRQAIEALPQGVNTSLDKVLLQTPGVSQDSAASGDLHVRNEHANFSIASTAFSSPTASGLSARFSTPGSSAASP